MEYISSQRTGKLQHRKQPETDIAAPDYEHYIFLIFSTHFYQPLVVANIGTAQITPNLIPCGSTIVDDYKTSMEKVLFSVLPMRTAT